MTMAANNRANPRSPGRTPPFILVGLIVLVGFLGFNYWSLSSTNSDLSAQLEKVNVQRRDEEQKNAEAEKNLEISREELRQVQGNLDQTNKQLSERDSELNNAKKDYSDKLVELDELRKTLEKCDSAHGEDKQQLDNLKAEKVQLEQQLTEEKNKAPPPCDVGKCLGPVKEIITIVSKLVGTEAMSKALQDANLDPSQLMEGIPQIPPPQPQQNVDQNQQQQQQQQQPQQQNPPQNNPNPPQGNESEGKGEPKNDEVVKEMSVDDNAVKQPNNESDKANGSLMYQPGKEEELKEESEKEGQIDENNAQEEKAGENDATLNNGEEVEEDGDNYETGNEGEEEEEEEGVTGNTPPPGQNTQDYGADDDEDGTAYDNEEEEEGEEGDNDAGDLDYQQGEGGNK